MFGKGNTEYRITCRRVWVVDLPPFDGKFWRWFESVVDNCHCRYIWFLLCLHRYRSGRLLSTGGWRLLRLRTLSIWRIECWMHLLRRLSLCLLNRQWRARSRLRSVGVSWKISTGGRWRDGRLVDCRVGGTRELVVGFESRLLHLDRRHQVRISLVRIAGCLYGRCRPSCVFSGGRCHGCLRS